MTEKTLNRPDWLVRKSTGIQEGPTWSCHHEGRWYAVVKKPGGSYWAGRLSPPSPPSYARTRYEVLLKAGHGHSAGSVFAFEGRLTKERDAAIKRLVGALDDAFNLHEEETDKRIVSVGGKSISKTVILKGGVVIGEQG